MGMASEWTLTIREVGTYFLFSIRHYSAIFFYSALFSIRQRICNRIRIVDEYHKMSKNSNLLLTNHAKKDMWVWVESCLRPSGLGSHRAQQIFLGGSSGSLRARKVFWEGESTLLSSTYYLYSYSQIVDPNYSALLDIGLFGRFSLFIHPYFNP